MKKRIITIIAVFLTGSAVFNSKAIVPVPADSLLQLELAEEFTLLEKDRVPNGLLKDYGLNYVDYETFDGVNVSSNSYVNMATFELILRSIRNTAVGIKPYGPVNTIISQMSATYNSGTNPIGIVLYEYSKIKATALADNEITYSEQNGAQDVYINNVWQNPYESDVIAAFSPYINVERSQTVTFYFGSAYRFTNRNITSVQFDAGDGVGYRTVSNNGSVQISYSTTGQKELKLKIYYDGNQMAECRSNIVIEAPITVTPSSFVEDATQSFTASASYMGYQPTASVSIKYSGNNTSGTLKNPVIVAEGFDPISNINDNSTIPGKGSSTIIRYLGAGYSPIGDNDIVYVDWGNSAAPIQANADILKQVITWVNSVKASDASSNILIGESMGGLIARYALCSMESASIPHDVSVYLSHDAPHLGVNVPLGAVYAIQHYLNVLMDPDEWFHYVDVLANVLGFSHLNTITTIQEILDLRNAPSVRQMLINYVNSDYQLDNSLHNTFMSELNQMGFPHGDVGKTIKNLTYSNGGLNTFSNTNTLATVNLEATANMGIKALLNILLPGIAYGLDITMLGLWGVIPGETTLSYEANIYPFSASGVTVFSASGSYQKTNFLGSVLTPLFSYSYSSPTSIPMDIVNGSYYALSEGENDSALISLGGNSSIMYRKKIVFVPTVSSLCYKNGSTPLIISDYNYDFFTNGVDFGQIPFDGYRFNSSASTGHIYGGITALNWARDCSMLSLTGPSIATEGSTYSVITSYPITWSTSNSQIATISSGGVLHAVGFGIFDIIATITMANGKVQLRKSVSIPEPVFPGFPTYVLNKTDMTVPGVVLDSYPFQLNAQRQSSTGSEFYSYFTYYWGEKVGSNPITWITSSSLLYNTSVTTGQIKTIYFKAYYNGQYSTVYSTTIRHMDMVVPMGMDSDGNIHFDEEGEDNSIQVKGEVGNYVYTYQIDSHTFEFDHEASARELCQAMLECADIVARIKTLRPWGEKELLTIDFSRINSDTEEVQEGIVLIFYQDAGFDI